jgi:hypothetical protein
MFRNILVAIDSLADSNQALEEGIDLAESERGRPVRSSTPTTKQGLQSSTTAPASLAGGSDRAAVLPAVGRAREAPRRTTPYSDRSPPQHVTKP